MAKVDKHFLGNASRGYDYLDKKTNVLNQIAYMFNKSNIMFKYVNLPDTIPPKEMEILIQKNGFGIFTKIEEEFYIVSGGLGGEHDVYNRPTKAIISIPYLNYNADLEIGEDCIIVKNDSLGMGLLPLYQKYCTILNENEITMVLATINKRIQNLLSANDDNTIESAKEYLKRVEEGKIGVIAEQRLFDSLKINNSNSTGGTNLTELFEFQQYFKASLYNEIGLNANFNMKRERLSSAEVETNTDNLYPLVDDMLDNRRLALKEINELYGLNIQVEFNSSWDYRVFQGESIDTLKETSEESGGEIDSNIEPSEIIEGVDDEEIEVDEDVEVEDEEIEEEETDEEIISDDEVDEVEEEEQEDNEDIGEEEEGIEEVEEEEEEE